MREKIRMDKAERDDYNKKLELSEIIKLVQYEKVAAQAQMKKKKQNIKTSFSQNERDLKEYNRLL